MAQQQSPVDESIEQSLAELFQRGWLTGKDQLAVSDAGKKHLSRRV
jgi:hypothetical protein